MLEYNPKWCFKPPADGKFFNSSIPPGALGDFHTFIDKVGTQGRRRDTL